MVKDPRVLVAAYDDAAGITAEFNLNALEHLNQRLGTDFDPSSFQIERSGMRSSPESKCTS